MCASRSPAFAYLRSPSLAAVVERSTAAPPLRPWRERLTTWLIGGLDKADELPPRYLADNHLRRDIGLPPIMLGGWPH